MVKTESGRSRAEWIYRAIEVGILLLGFLAAGSRWTGNIESAIRGNTVAVKALAGKVDALDTSGDCDRERISRLEAKSNLNPPPCDDPPPSVATMGDPKK